MLRSLKFDILNGIKVTFHIIFDRFLFKEKGTEFLVYKFPITDRLASPTS